MQNLLEVETEFRDGEAWQVVGHSSAFHPLVSRSGWLPTDKMMQKSVASWTTGTTTAVGGI